MVSNERFEKLFLSINKSSTIILIGFMGSGKTSFGKELAHKLNYQFLDTDTEIENLMGMSIKELFEIKGEKYFRLLEKQFIEKLNVHNTVVATGGGTPCFYNNMEVLNQKGVTVYLKYSVESLYSRLKEDNHRPLLANKTSEELYRFISLLLEKREPFYLKAQTIF